MSAYKIGDRVVYLHPSPTMGTALATEVQGMVLVDLDDGRELHADPNSLRPAMPRGSDDLDKYGRWWWLGDRPVLAERRDDGWMVWRDEPKRSWPVVAPSCDWRGPVAPPPEVRP